MRPGVISLLFAFLVACSTPQHHAPSLGEAYVGPATLPLRQELTPNSPVTSTVKHGDKLEIVENKRRFVKVRAQDGSEGWADTHQLLMPDQMAALRSMTESAMKFPSQGTATVFEPLNMHTEPNRGSPSFWQIPESGSAEVIDHRLTPRVAAAQASSAPSPKPRVSRRKGKDKGAPSKNAPPPAPAPKPPENWLELSVPKEEALEPPKPVTKAERGAAAAVKVPMEDWALVRTKDGKVGWVLMRALNLAIPDEVAQYAEGHRITSYFAIGDVPDGDSVKKNWLWTTIAKGQEPYEFDSIRVFVWNRKRRRYETAFIERKIRGHYPVHVDTSGAVPTFSILVEGDGAMYRKTYTFAGYHIRMIKKEPYDIAPKPEAVKQVASTPAQKPKATSWYARAKEKVRSLFH